MHRWLNASHRGAWLLVGSSPGSCISQLSSTHAAQFLGCPGHGVGSVARGAALEALAAAGKVVGVAVLAVPVALAEGGGGSAGQQAHQQRRGGSEANDDRVVPGAETASLELAAQLFTHLGAPP